MQHPKASFALLCGAAVLLAGCSGGTPWGATPQHIPLPRIDNIAATLDAGSTAGSQRLAERVRTTLAAEPRLASSSLRVEGLEGGVIVLNGSPPGASERDLAVQTARKVAGVRDVVDRMASP
ncbi:BON domain-containing protein [Ottowia thiooxydans]|uniref:BON domain-containing protein n=1 Tax=Ottowia thiooxydans TaxID=219182 RepID=UPI000427185E|nr:BON domain-containing protein [Ottowia thiooxydans]